MALGRHIDMEEFLVATYPGGHILMLERSTKADKSALPKVDWGADREWEDRWLKDVRVEFTPDDKPWLADLRMQALEWYDRESARSFLPSLERCKCMDFSMFEYLGGDQIARVRPIPSPYAAVYNEEKGYVAMMSTCTLEAGFAYYIPVPTDKNHVFEERWIEGITIKHETDPSLEMVKDIREEVIDAMDVAIIGFKDLVLKHRSIAGFLYSLMGGFKNPQVSRECESLCHVISEVQGLLEEKKTREAEGVLRRALRDLKWPHLVNDSHRTALVLGLCDLLLRKGDKRSLDEAEGFKRMILKAQARREELNNETLREARTQVLAEAGRVVELRPMDAMDNWDVDLPANTAGQRKKKKGGGGKKTARKGNNKGRAPSSEKGEGGEERESADATPGSRGDQSNGSTEAGEERQAPPEECPICLTELVEDEEDDEEEERERCTMLSCQHRFHARCMTVWLEKCREKDFKASCPMCRQCA